MDISSRSPHGSVRRACTASTTPTCRRGGARGTMPPCEPWLIRTTDFVAMMTLEPHGPDTCVGTGPRYPWGGLYGGQIVAQALRAAAATVEPQFRVHSLHAYFIRRGDHTEPVRYEVDRVRNGRSFVTRTVTARQAVGAILSMSASFQVDEEAPEVQTADLPDVPGQAELAHELVDDHVRPGHRAHRRPAGPGPGLDAHHRRRRRRPRAQRLRPRLHVRRLPHRRRGGAATRPPRPGHRRPRSTRSWPSASTTPSGSTGRCGPTTGTSPP